MCHISYYIIYYSLPYAIWLLTDISFSKTNKKNSLILNFLKPGAQWLAPGGAWRKIIKDWPKNCDLRVCRPKWRPREPGVFKIAKSLILILLQGGQKKIVFFSQFTATPFPRLHRCKRPSKLSTQCKCTVTPIGWLIFLYHPPPLLLGQLC